jgi:putative oxidoreductase
MATMTKSWFTTEAATDHVDRPRLVTAVVWTLQVAVAAMFLMAGTSKLAGVPMMVQMFDAIGIGQWFRYLTGTIEVLSAILLLVPQLARYGALAAVATMVGAVFVHLAVVGGSPLVPILLLAAAVSVAWIRRAGR